MNLKEKVPRGFPKEVLLGQSNDEQVPSSEYNDMLADSIGLKTTPVVGRSLSTPDSLRPAKSVIRKSLRPKIGSCKSDAV